jgi:outer membrane protein, multidrug efflux system
VIPDDERQTEQTENQISLLLGKNPGPVTRGRSLTEQQTPPEVPAGLPSKLLERRPEIQAAEQTLIANNANIGVAKAAYFPQITLTGYYGYQSIALANLFSGSRRLWNFLPQLTQPIFTAGRLSSQVELAEAQQRSALAQYEGAIQTGFRDVSDALNSVPKREGSPRPARVAGDGVARPKTPRLHEISRRSRYDAQRSQFGSGPVHC